MSFLQAIEKPKWATYHERTTDISDLWQQETDPENEFGESCTAYFDKYEDRNQGIFVFAITGIGVEDNGGTRFYDRERAIDLLGLEAIWLAEKDEWEAI